ncbi:MAG: hypothetical protein PHI12_10130, partial [Dehalococcoidales bacterium]|nr:hypothetical protein [Dehalococcoidales bacterium]
DVQDRIDEMKRARCEVEDTLLTHRLEPIDPQVIMENVKDLRDFLEDSNLFERKAFLRSFIESIEVDDGQITLNYTLPMPPANSRQETLSVLGIVPIGGPVGIRRARMLEATWKSAEVCGLWY